jgi:hypothetical protein
MKKSAKCKILSTPIVLIKTAQAALQIFKPTGIDLENTSGGFQKNEHN